jgi:hypothetical protein
MATRRKRTTVLKAPGKSGRVTMADLYSALWELDRGLSNRFTSIQDSINEVGRRITTHEESHNNIHLRQTVDSQIKLDAKKVALGGAVITGFTVISAMTAALGKLVGLI